MEHSLKRMEHSCYVLFSFFFPRFGYVRLVRLVKECKKNVPFCLQEWKRMERTERSFEKNRCPTLAFTNNFCAAKHVLLCMLHFIEVCTLIKVFLMVFKNPFVKFLMLLENVFGFKLYSYFLFYSNQILQQERV